MKTQKENWHGNQLKEKEIKLTIQGALRDSTHDSTEILELVKSRMNTNESIITVNSMSVKRVSEKLFTTKVNTI